MTEQQNDIPAARDVLAKWRAKSPVAAWEVRPWLGGFDFAASDAPAVDLGGTRHEHTARLIVGTAGNPELLDAIDAQLAFAAEYAARPEQGRSGTGDLWETFADRVAAAILATDERMSA